MLGRSSAPPSLAANQPMTIANDPKDTSSKAEVARILGTASEA